MNTQQAKGYIFEKIVWEILKDNGYIDVQTARLRGRGAYHQIDAFGVLGLPIAFVHPIRIISEAKCFKSGKVRLEHIRNFVGVIKDLSENYIVKIDADELGQRYTDVGCFFSATSFTKDAQEYGWAQNIYLVSFSEITSLRSTIDNINNFATDNKKAIRKMTKEKLIDAYDDYNESRSFSDFVDIKSEYPSLALGIVDNNYPVVISGKKNWVKKIAESLPTNNDRVKGYKTGRLTKKEQTKFYLNLYDGEQIEFAIPNIIASNIIKTIDDSSIGDKIFEIDIPVTKNKDDTLLRRLIKIDVELEHSEKNKYINEIYKYKGKN